MTPRLHAPVDGAPLALFRVLFGAVMAVAMARTLAKGWVSTLLVEPRFHFPYPGFSWVRPAPAPLMQLVFVALALLALGISASRRPRLCAALFCLGFTYVELIDRALYLNHYYLVSLLAALLALLPAPSLRAPHHVPAWTLGALRLQVAVVYLFAGLTKLDGDWLLRAQPLRLWLPTGAGLPLVGPWLEEPWVAYAASWAGAAFDLSVVPLLLWRRTRAVALLAVVAFHLATALLFKVGMFPWIMIAAAALFAPTPAIRRALRIRGIPRSVARPGRAILAAVALHCAVQLALPARQYLQPEASAWTGRAFDFSWNVMKAERAGAVSYRVVDRRTGASRVVRPAAYLTPTQELALGPSPALIHALARRIAADEGGGVAVYAEAFASLNGRPSRALVDPNVDLAADRELR